MSENRILKSMSNVKRAVTLLIAFVAISATASWAFAAPKIIGIAGGPNGGAYYPLSIGVAKIIETAIPGIKVDVAVTAGAIANSTLVGTGEMDMGFTNGDAVYEAYTGTGRYAKGKLPDIRILFGGVPGGVFHVVVAKTGPISSLGQLKGKRVAIGPQGGATEYVAPTVLKYYGIEKSDMKLTYVSYSDGIQALSDGQVDAAMVTSPIPAQAIKQLGAVGKLEFKILGIEPDKAAQFIKDNPFFVQFTLAGKMYGLDQDILTVATTNIMSVNAKLDTETVYKITKGIFENLDILTKAHPSARGITLKTAPVTYIPLHPGAEKYYREKGLIR
jgi:TRAP transporter TAXI family solute receptor